MSELQHHIKPKKGSERSFGLIIGVIVFLFGLYPMFKGEAVHLWAIAAGSGFIVAGLFMPKILILPNLLWFRLGLLLGSVVSPLVMALVFFLTVLPTGLVLRLFRKDILRQKLEPAAESYWIIRDEPVGSMKNQY